MGSGEVPSEQVRETTLGTPRTPQICKNENAPNFSPQTPKRQRSSAKLPQQPRCGFQPQIEAPGRPSIPQVFGNSREKKKKKPNQNERVGHARFPCRSTTTWRCRIRYKNPRLMRWKPRKGLKTFFFKVKYAATWQIATERASTRRNCVPVPPTTPSKRSGGRQA